MIEHVYMYVCMYVWFSLHFIYLKSLFIYFREKGREGEREGKKHQCARETSIGCLSHTPSQGPGPQPRHVPWPGIEPATFWFPGWHPAHWATPGRAHWKCVFSVFNIVTRLCNISITSKRTFYSCILIHIKPKQTLFNEAILCLIHCRWWMLIVLVLCHSIPFLSITLKNTSQWLSVLLHVPWLSCKDSLESLSLDLGRSFCPACHSTIFLSLLTLSTLATSRCVFACTVSFALQEGML